MQVVLSACVCARACTCLSEGVKGKLFRRFSISAGVVQREKDQALNSSILSLLSCCLSFSLRKRRVLLLASVSTSARTRKPQSASLSGSQAVSQFAASQFNSSQLSRSPLVSFCSATDNLLTVNRKRIPTFYLLLHWGDVGAAWGLHFVLFLHKCFHWFSFILSSHDNSEQFFFRQCKTNFVFTYVKACMQVFHDHNTTISMHGFLSKINNF